MTLIKAIVQWFAAMAATLLALVTGKMMLSDDSDLPAHLRRENLD